MRKGVAKVKPHFYFEFTRRVGVPVVCALGMAVMLSTLVPPDALYASSIITTFVPDVAVRTHKGPQGQHVYNQFRSSTTSTGGNVYEEEDSVAKVRIYQEPGNQWRLDVTAKQDLKDVCFPYGSNAPALSSDLSSLIVYIPKGGGAYTEKARLLTGSQPDDSWGVYPGNFASPFLILANDLKARIVAAVNWPPRLVAPLYAAGRTTMHYHNYGLAIVKKDATEVYYCLVADVQPDPALYETSWQMAADQYRNWLRAHAPTPQYSDWMVKGNGFINLSLSAYNFSVQYLHQLVDPYKSIFNLVIMWGQMSPQGQQCCDFKQEIDPHYQPGLGQFTREMVSQGYHVAFYSRPYVQPNDWRKLDTPQGREWFLGWLEKNRSYGATAFYLDTFGGVYWGSPPEVINLLSSGAIPYDSVMEGYSDIYPRASLISGCLVGFATCGGPERDPQ